MLLFFASHPHILTSSHPPLQVKRKGSSEKLLYPIRYLHRDFLQQDINEPGEYELAVEDVSTHEDNVAMKQWLTCGRYNMHLSLEDYKDRQSSDCNLVASEYSPVSLTSSTANAVIFYGNVELPSTSSKREVKFDLESSFFKTWSYTKSGTSIEHTLFRRDKHGDTEDLSAVATRYAADASRFLCSTTDIVQHQRFIQQQI